MRRLWCVPGLCVSRVPCQRWQGKSQLMCTKRPLYWESWGKIKFVKKALSDALLITRFEKIEAGAAKNTSFANFSDKLFAAQNGRLTEFAPGKISDSQNFSSEFSFPHSMLLFFSWCCGVDSSIPHCNLQSTNVSHKQLNGSFRKRNIKSKAPDAEVVKFQEFDRKIAEMSCVHFTRLLDLFWHYLKKFQEFRILRKSRKNRDFLLRQI